MKQFALFVALIAGLSLAFTTPIETVAVNLSSSTVAWRGYKVLGEHTGTVKLTSGTLDFDGETLVGGRFVIDMTSIVCTDLTGETRTKLEGHLKSDDFFGVANFPEATLQITNAIPYGTDGKYKVVGNLTIKDTTKEIKFFTTIAEENGQRVATSEITVDRSEYNVRYGSGSFFDSLGDNTIYDEFDINVRLVLN
jgi:polyisoprenoid-binding protein YceI